MVLSVGKVLKDVFKIPELFNKVVSIECQPPPPNSDLIVPVSSQNVSEEVGRQMPSKESFPNFLPHPHSISEE